MASANDSNRRIYLVPLAVLVLLDRILQPRPVRQLCNCATSNGAAVYLLGFGLCGSESDALLARACQILVKLRDFQWTASRVTLLPLDASWRNRHPSVVRPGGLEDSEEGLFRCCRRPLALLPLTDSLAE